MKTLDIYEFSIENSNTFFAENILVHNIEPPGGGGGNAVPGSLRIYLGDYYRNNFAVNENQSANSIANNLKNFINNGSWPYSATKSGTDITVTADSYGSQYNGTISKTLIDGDFEFTETMSSNPLAGGDALGGQETYDLTIKDTLHIPPDNVGGNWDTWTHSNGFTVNAGDSTAIIAGKIKTALDNYLSSNSGSGFSVSVNPIYPNSLTLIADMGEPTPANCTAAGRQRADYNQAWVRVGNDLTASWVNSTSSCTAYFSGGVNPTLDKQTITISCIVENPIDYVHKMKWYWPNASNTDIEQITSGNQIYFPPKSKTRICQTLTFNEYIPDLRLQNLGYTSQEWHAAGVIDAYTDYQGPGLDEWPWELFKIYDIMVTLGPLDHPYVSPYLNHNKGRLTPSKLIYKLSDLGISVAYDDSFTVCGWFKRAKQHDIGPNGYCDEEVASHTTEALCNAGSGEHSDGLTGHWFELYPHPDRIGNRAPLFELGNYYQNKETSLTVWFNSSENLSVMTYNDNSGSYWNKPASHPLNNGELHNWFFVALRYNNEGDHKLYLYSYAIDSNNNVKEQSTVNNSVIGLDSAPIADKITIGGYGWTMGSQASSGNNRGWFGEISEFLCVQDFLTDAELNNFATAEDPHQELASQTVIDAGKITTGEINANLIKVTNIDATNITSGTLRSRNLEYDGEGQQIKGSVFNLNAGELYLVGSDDTQITSHLIFQDNALSIKGPIDATGGTFSGQIRITNNSNLLVDEGNIITSFDAESKRVEIHGQDNALRIFSDVGLVFEVDDTAIETVYDHNSSNDTVTLDPPYPALKMVRGARLLLGFDENEPTYGDRAGLYMTFSQPPFLSSYTGSDGNSLKGRFTHGVNAIFDSSQWKALNNEWSPIGIEYGVSKTNNMGFWKVNVGRYPFEVGGFDTFVAGNVSSIKVDNSNLELGGGISLASFTGAHFSVCVDQDPEILLTSGLIVEATGKYNTYGRVTPDILDTWPTVSVCNSNTSSKVFGVSSGDQKLNESFLSGLSSEEKELCEGFTWWSINAIGEGGVWVTNYNGNFENGDYITSSEIPGYGMKQDDDLLHNYTVAKITQDCTFDITTTRYETKEIEQDGHIYIAAFVGCTYHCG